MTIHHLITINGALLMVYHTDSKCYQYSIALWDGEFYQPEEVYYTAEKALEVGTKRIKVVIGYEW